MSADRQTLLRQKGADMFFAGGDFLGAIVFSYTGNYSSPALIGDLAFIRTLVSNPKVYHRYYRFHRLRGSASPVLTATHHSCGSPRLSHFFSSRLWGSDPSTDIHAKWLERRVLTQGCALFTV